MSAPNHLPMRMEKSYNTTIVVDVQEEFQTPTPRTSNRPKNERTEQSLGRLGILLGAEPAPEEPNPQPPQPPQSVAATKAPRQVSPAPPRKPAAWDELASSLGVTPRPRRPRRHRHRHRRRPGASQTAS